jgi:uncharacterized protein (DUF1499 family)
MAHFPQILLFICAGIGLIIVLGLSILAILARVVKSPPYLGVRDGQLASCPSSPNCVSTQSQDEMHRIAPIALSTSIKQTQTKLLQIIQSMERTRIIVAEPTYIHAEFRTPVIEYVDDVEFYIDGQSGLIHFRSASRLPYWDWGVNRNRMETIRRAFEAQ